ncbi:PREDICTED: membrane metallo-endopeptidase-like 1 isoform X2 [Dinoponera quadriceps]|uniref:Membrane metallo-endopeptidase-like 1 isoform X2 n=1 Tax=Dinoponera quadriceps TaxID=609295 RepID=A0A6P3XU01_DINQU|nr:PREDICTED: membrane metallo-endopeptidase-like 1 isoform X2 [Dinoponera quadriceps]
MRLLSLFFSVIVARVIGIPTRKLADCNVCKSDACREIGEAIRRGIDGSSDPCINFYNYGCGSWPAHDPIPPSELQWSTDDKYSLRISRRAKGLLEGKSKYDDLPFIKKLKQYYRSCMDEDAIERQGLTPIMTLIDANGGWPIIMGKASTGLKNFTWQEIDNTYNQLFAGSSFFNIKYETNEEDATRHILTISIDNSVLSGLLWDELEEEDESSLDPNLYLDTMIYIIKAFAKHKKVKIDSISMSEEIKKLYTFEANFENITELSEQEVLKGLDMNETKMTISELQEYYDLAKPQNLTAKINWLQTIQFIFKNVNVSINSSEPVIVYNKELLHKLAHLLDDTSPRVLVNFIQWNLVNAFIPFLNKNMRDIDFELKYKAYNVTEQEPRWKTCIDYITLSDALSYLYIKRYNVTNNIKAAIKMMEEIKTEMKEHILHSEWADNSTKKFIIAKLDNLILQVGYPEWYNNQTALNERYEGLLVGENYFKNALSMLIYEKERFFKKFREPVDRYEWTNHPLIKNPFYDYTNNRISIPVAEILYPYFTLGMPLAVNYGAIGMVFGHEIAHSFDSDGMQYDKFGNKHSWHNEKTTEAFDKKVKCFVDQYNNFILNTTDEDEEPIQINGLLTKDENIADNVGLAVAFAAFQKRLVTAELQLKLPGLKNVTDEQLFFLSFVNNPAYSLCYTFEIWENSRLFLFSFLI